MTLLERLRVIPANLDCAGRNTYGGHEGPCQCQNCQDRVAAADEITRLKRERDDARACVEECRAVASVMSMTLTDLLTRLDPALTPRASAGDVGVADDGPLL
jgi:hypothetical protein